MKTLIKKELLSMFCSPVVIVFSAVFFIPVGLMNWVFPGTYNILDNGYATLDKFFSLSSIVLLIILPALTMRSFSEEKRTGNIEILRSAPVRLSSLYLSKVLALLFVVFIVLLISVFYVYTLSVLANPAGNIDLHEITASYVSLLLLSLLFISIGVFSSILTSNQFIAFIVAIIINFILFYGFDLLSALFSSGNTQSFVLSLSVSPRYNLMQKGVFQLKDILVIINYIIVFSVLGIFFLSLRTGKNRRNLLIAIISLVICNILFLLIPDLRFDFTKDKRYTVSKYSRKVLEGISGENDNIYVKVYLEGDLNPGFRRLYGSVKDILSDFSRYTDNRLSTEYIDPNALGEQQQIYSYMADKRMPGIVLNELNRDGRNSQKIIYPYAQVIHRSDTLNINLLKRVTGYSAEENLNLSVENLEFEFIDAIRLLQKKEPEYIAFIEGHGELPRPYVYDAEELLSKYFFVSRGQIGYDISDLDGFKAVIIAGSRSRFSEREKFILDQYIMGGGKVLWLVDGVYFSEEEMKNNMESPSMKNDTNLDDLLFAYGVRINPVLIQDYQSTNMYVTTRESGQYSEIPFYYSPLLLPSIDHPVTKDISLVRAPFSSTIDILTKDSLVTKDILLTTSAHSHIVKVPEMINFDFEDIQNDPGYFNESFLPVAVAMTGIFKSPFANRMMPDSIVVPEDRVIMNTSVENRMIVAASSYIIENELAGSGSQTQVLPMGYDRVSEQQFGNRDFIINAVNWLTVDNDEAMELRTKSQQIRLLNKQLVYNERDRYAALNTIVPLFLIGIIVVCVYVYRRIRYTK